MSKAERVRYVKQNLAKLRKAKPDSRTNASKRQGATNHENASASGTPTRGTEESNDHDNKETESKSDDEDDQTDTVSGVMNAATDV